MNQKEIFKEILSSPKMKELLGIPIAEEINEDFDSSSPCKEVAIVRSIIEGQMRHTSDDALFKNIKKIYDL